MDELVLIIGFSAAAGGAVGVVIVFFIAVMCEKVSAWIKKRKNSIRISVSHKYNEP